jgi:ABC-type Fe3+/spermidine/putrescine transport system ATPase subunit
MVDTAGGPLVGRVTKPGWTPGPGGEVLLSIRPEAWRLDTGRGENGVTGKIIERSYLGQRIQYVVETAAGPQQVVELNPLLVRDPGEQVVKLSARHADVAVLEA